MQKFAVRLLTLAMFSTALVAGPVLKAYAAGSDNPAPPAADTYVRRSVTPAALSAATVSPPPATETSLFALVRSAA